MTDFAAFIRRLPKVELHVHLEGTLEPAMMLRLAAKHGVRLPWCNLSEVKRAYAFDSLQSFLDLYYLGASVLLDEQDFFDLMWAYLERCREEGIVHAEIMFDPQAHTQRGVPFEIFMSGMTRAMSMAEQQWGQSAILIMCFLRHLPEASALETLAQAARFRSQILAVGLDSSEVGHPPGDFQTVFRLAGEQGYHRVAHAGEEGPPSYIRDALDLLQVSRIDHGVSCLADEALVKRLVSSAVPLTLCPLSNVRLCVFDDITQHPVLDMLDLGLTITVNSDDPAYFGGYLSDNFMALHTALGMDKQQAIALIRNSITSSFLAPSIARQHLAELDRLTKHL